MNLAIVDDLQHQADTALVEIEATNDQSASNNFKGFLLNFINEVKPMDSLLKNIANLNTQDLNSLYHDSKYLSSVFDKTHQKYYEKNYFNDAELKSMLKDIGKTLHRLENLAHNCYTKNLPNEKTPDYIKSGLTKYSQEVLSKKLSK
jgi:hypothetical protein